MRSFRFVPHFVTKKAVILPFAITVFGRRRIFISPLFFFSALENQWVECFLVGIVLLLNSLSHYRDNNFKEVFFEANILKCANEKSIFCQVVQTLLRVLKLFAFIVIVWLVCWTEQAGGLLKNEVVLFFKK